MAQGMDPDVDMDHHKQTQKHYLECLKLVIKPKFCHSSHPKLMKTNLDTNHLAAIIFCIFLGYNDPFLDTEIMGKVLSFWMKKK